MRFHEHSIKYSLIKPVRNHVSRLTGPNEPNRVRSVTGCPLQIEPNGTLATLVLGTEGQESIS